MSVARLHEIIVRCAVLLFVLGSTAGAAQPPHSEGVVSADLVRCQHGAVVSVSPLASEIGVEILAQGGNAVDAAVATAFVLEVTWPEAGNIGGGGYMLVVPTRGRGTPIVVDFRERAPAAATRDMFVDPRGRTPHRRVGVPGTVRGLALAHSRFGQLPWKQLLAPSIELARNGFELDAAAAESLNTVLRRSRREQFDELWRVFSRPDSQPWRTGDRLRQPELAHTLELIADHGADAFYTGPVAEQIVAEMRHGGGLITKEDLAAYQPKLREPVKATYRGFEILSSPPSSSGGTTLVESLNILENFDLRPMGRWSTRTLHLMVEAMKRSYRDRASYLGDPDVVSIPAMLTNKDYARQLARQINLEHATPSASLAGDIRLSEAGPHTTHLSVVDRERTAVSLTYTLESLYGSRVVVKGAGFLLNDEMNDFGWLPGVTDTSGRIGTPPNLIAPGKRMLSSMCPTVLLRDGKPVLVTGSPGGRTIINTVLCVIVDVIDFEMEPRAAVDAPRLHHQWLPDLVKVENRLAREHPAAISGLTAMGHRVQKEGSQGDAHTIAVDSKSGELIGVADKREDGKAAGY